MRTSSARATCSLLSLVALLVACSDPPIELAGSYTGNARCDGETLRMNDDFDEDGRGTATRTEFDWHDDNIVLTFRRVDPTQLELELDDCTILFHHSAPPHDRRATVAPGQRCQIHEETFDHEVPIRGSADFDRAASTVHVSLDTNARVGDGDRLVWSYVFRGTRPTPR